MKEVNNKLDDMFKSALEDYSQEPSPKLLNVLNKKMFFKDIARFNFRNLFSKSIIKYSSYVVISVSTFVASYYLINNNKTDNKNSNQIISQSQINTQNHNTSDTLNNNIRNISSNNSLENKTTINDSLNNNQKNILNNKNEANTVINNSTHQNSLKKIEPNLSDKNTTDNKNTVNNTTQTDLNKNKLSSKGNSKNKPNGNNISDKKNLDISASDSKNKFESIKILEEKNKNKNTIDNNKNIYNTSDLKNINYKITLLQPKPAFTIKNDGENTSSDFIPINDNNKETIKKNNTKSKYIFPKYAIEVYGGGDYVNKILSSPLNTYINERNKTEKSIYTYNFGADIKYTLKNTFIQAGVNKSIVGENVVITTISKLLDSSASHFNYQYHQIIHIDTIGWIPVWDSIHRDSIPILDSVIFNTVDSNWVSVYDSVNKENKYNIKNRINYIEIPVLIGFNFGNSPLRFNVATGVSFGFLTNSKGKLIRPYTNDVSDFNKTYFPFNKIIYNYILRAGCFYIINERWSIFMRGSFKYNINSIFDKSYPVNQKYYTIGIQGGISVNL